VVIHRDTAAAEMPPVEQALDAGNTQGDGGGSSAQVPDDDTVRGRWVKPWTAVMITGSGDVASGP
jgi:hypothetical protein